MHNVKIYAVISTIGVVKIDRCLKSLMSQTLSLEKIIVIDQGAGLTSIRDDIDDLCKSCPGCNVQYERQDCLGVSRGRNFGLTFVPADGLVFFPDDDAHYESDFVEILAREICDGYDFCSGAIFIDRSLKRGRLPGKVVTREKIDLKNVLWSFCEATLMIKRSVILHEHFDERLGVGAGTRAGGDEGADLVVRLLCNGYKGIFNPSAKVYHPDKIQKITPEIVRKARGYARGRGVILRRYSFPNVVKLREIFRPFLGFVYYLVKIDLKNSFYYWNVTVGKLEGYFRSEKMLT